MNQTDTYTSLELVSASTLHRAPHWRGKQSESSMLKHSPSSSAVSSLSTQHKLQLPFQTTSSSRGLNPCRRHFLWMVSCPRHTWECPVSSVDPPVQQRAAQLQSLLGDCSSGPALSDERGWSSELRPEKHSLPVWPGSQKAYTHKYINTLDVLSQENK